MTIETTYTQARAHLAELCDRVVDDCETVIITRRGAKNVALIAADELSSILETAHLLSFPANAERLLTALERARQRTTEPQSVEQLRQEMGLDER